MFWYYTIHSSLIIAKLKSSPVKNKISKLLFDPNSQNGGPGQGGERAMVGFLGSFFTDSSALVSHSSGLWEGSQPRKRGTRRKKTGHMSGKRQSVLSALWTEALLMLPRLDTLVDSLEMLIQDHGWNSPALSIALFWGALFCVSSNNSLSLVYRNPLRLSFWKRFPFEMTQVRSPLEGVSFCPHEPIWEEVHSALVECLRTSWLKTSQT